MVRQFFKNGVGLFSKRQTTILSAALIMMFLVLASRVLGLARNRLLAHFFPIDLLDSYRLAFFVPDLIANILITGTLSVAFIPVFTNYLSSNDEKEGWKVASSILNICLLFFGVIAILVFIFIPVIYSFNPGLASDPEKLNLAANLTRIILFGEFILIIGSFLTSVLQSFHRFIIPALAPVLYNLGIIAGILWFRPVFGLYGVAWGVVAGALLHAIIQFFLVRKLGYKYKFKLEFKNPGVGRIIKLSLPRAVGIAFAQGEWGVSLYLSLLLISGSAAVLGFANDIQNFPIGLFGITFATAAFPTLSSEWALGKIQEFKATFLSTLHQILYLTVPLSVLFIVLRIPIVRIMLGTGYFDWNSTVATAVAASYFAIGIFAQSCLFLLIRAFYSLHDAGTPLKVALGSLIFHTVLSASFVYFVAKGSYVPVSYIALASSITGIATFIVLLFLLDKKIGGFGRRKLFLPAFKIFLSSFLMGVLLYIPLHLRLGDKYVIDFIIDTTRVFNLLLLTGAAFAFGIIIYIYLTWWLRSEELKAFAKLIPDLRKLNKFLVFEEKIDSGNTATPV